MTEQELWRLVEEWDQAHGEQLRQIQRVQDILRLLESPRPKYEIRTTDNTQGLED